MISGVATFIVQTFTFNGEGLLHTILFAMTTALINIAFLGAFKASFNTQRAITRSLSANAYGMYLVHYVFVVWCQYALVHVDVPAGAKFIIVFVLASLLSWLVVKKTLALTRVNT